MVTSTPSGVYCCASESVNASMACLLIEYAVNVGLASIPEIEPMLTMRPFCAVISGRKARVMRTGP